MYKTLILTAALAPLATAALAAPVGLSPYAGQETRAIKSMSSEEVTDLLEGRGMGFAKTAELNGYPGPAHVLELADELKLTAQQRAQTEALVKAMQVRARHLGKRLVEEERKLDRLFSERQITKTQLTASLRRLGRLQAQLRAVHLEAHLDQTALLTPEQVTHYRQLRGYTGADSHRDHAHGHHH